MGRSKEQYIHLIGIKPSDTIFILRKKIKLLEEEIKRLKNDDKDRKDKDSN
jgi:hypothetical protein